MRSTLYLVLGGAGRGVRPVGSDPDLPGPGVLDPSLRQADLREPDLRPWGRAPGV